ncbi:MAG TPA: cation diffusion facilitator family transporter [Elusimicrobiota bacterium]|nr:cation diffusion facilitator family transporter [Elusimicrobiota bacterium]
MMHAHQHSHISHETRRALGMSLGFTLLLFAVELAGGLWTHSIALLSDSFHVFVDGLALGLAYLSVTLAERPASSERTYGWHRAEVLAALANGVFVAVLGFGIVWEAVQRMGNMVPIKTGPMLFVAVSGLLVNLVIAWKLHSFSHGDINVRGAFLHVIGDTLASVGVVVGGMIVHWSRLWIVDPLVGIFIAGLILVNGVRLIKDSVHILLEGVPDHLRLDDVVESIKEIPGVERVDDIHIWTICSHFCSMSAHVKVAFFQPDEQKKASAAIHSLLQTRYGIHHATIELSTDDPVQP